MKNKVNIFWFRRDLRLTDNRGLFEALNSGIPVLPIFIFDTEILGKLSQKEDARVTFIYDLLAKIKNEIEKSGSSLKVLHGKPLEEIEKLVAIYNVSAVYINLDYEPYSINRDAAVHEFLQNKKIEFHAFNDHLIFVPNEILKDNGEPYTVFTPYSKKWKLRFAETHIATYPSEKLLNCFVKTEPFNFPGLNEIGFVKSKIRVPEMDISEKMISDYDQQRDFPAVAGTTRIGPYLRFGKIGIRRLTQKAQSISEVFLNELIWRNFFADILWHFPQVENRAFKPKYDFIAWRNNEAEFKLWCEGKTGYPLVDAGMRELNKTGFMHNRVRMVTASFLAKHLLIDWRWGEAYFAEKLLDFELASNNGNWQWAAGCGCDAAPYFRVFNPEAQQKKFDNAGKYILKWVPEYGTLNYPRPIVDHKFARERVLNAYKTALK